MKNPLFLLSFVSLFAGVVSGQSVLEYRLTKGDIFTVEQQAEQKITQSLEGTTHEITNRISGVLQFRVMDEKEDSYLLEFMFRDLIFQIESSLQGVLLDVHAAEPDATDQQSRIFNALLHIPVQMELSRHGQILAVTGGDSLVSRVVREAALPDGFSRAMLRKSLEQQYGSKALAQSYEQMTYFYPSGPVREGDQWENSYEGKLEADNTWKLDSLSTDRATISGLAAIRMQVDDTGSSMDLRGDQTTLVHASPESGFLMEMRVKSRAEGVSTTAQTGELQIPTAITSNVIYRLIDHTHVQ